MEASKTSSQTKSLKPKIKILVQPSHTHFWHKNEEKTSCIPGAHGIKFPTIRITNYRGPVTVIISCVTKDPPYKPHPHQLLNGTTMNKHGVAYIYKRRLKNTIPFKDLFIESAEEEDVIKYLTDREHSKVDPFNTGFEHKYSFDDAQLNCVRLCFQVVLESRSYRHVQVDPVVSKPIYNIKNSSQINLNICSLSHYSATVDGGTQMCILCDKVPANDIEVRFYHEESKWEACGKLVGPCVFKQVALVIETPAFKTDTLSPESIKAPIQVYVQLQRPSNGEKSVPRPFQLLPLVGSDYQSRYSDATVSLKRKRSEYTKASSVSICKELQAKLVKEFIKEGKLSNDVPCEPWELPQIGSSTETTDSSKLRNDVSLYRPWESPQIGSSTKTTDSSKLGNDVPCEPWELPPIKSSTKTTASSKLGNDVPCESWELPPIKSSTKTTASSTLGNDVPCELWESPPIANSTKTTESSKLENDVPCEPWELPPIKSSTKTTASSKLGNDVLCELWESPPIANSMKTTESSNLGNDVLCEPRELSPIKSSTKTTASSKLGNDVPCELWESPPIANSMKTTESSNLGNDVLCEPWELSPIKSSPRTTATSKLRNGVPCKAWELFPIRSSTKTTASSKLGNDVPCEAWELTPITSSTETAELSKLMPNIFTPKLRPRLLKSSPVSSYTDILSYKPIQHDQQMDAMYPFNFKPAQPTESSTSNLTDFEAFNTLEDVLEVINEDLNSKQIISNSTGTSGLSYEQQTNFILSLPSVGVASMSGPNANTNSNMQQMDNFVHTEVMQEQSVEFDTDFLNLFENSSFNIEDCYI